MPDPPLPPCRGGAKGRDGPDLDRQSLLSWPPEQVADSLPCGPDVGEHVEKIRPFIDAGFTEVALVQISSDSAAGVHLLGAARLLAALRSL
ncbi:MAG: hypothetical protein ACXVSA_22790 [Solirubrobacteraceae bacterium]